MNTKELIQALPKAELHLHLEGAVPWETVRKNCPDALPESPEWWADDFRYDDFAQGFSHAMTLNIRYGLQTIDDYHFAAKAIFAKLIAQNVRYVEISFAPILIIRKGYACHEIIDAIKSATPDGLCVRVYGAFNRARPKAINDLVCNIFCNTPNLDGVDLHGDERVAGAEGFAPHFAQINAMGLPIRAHAGELRGADSVIDVLDHLGVRRIEHGTNAIHDDALIQRLIDDDVTLDMCPTSNLKLNVIDTIEAHPIRQFYERGVKVTVNTDDPTAFGCSLNSELALLVDKLGFSLSDLADLQRNAFNVANISDHQRDALMHELGAWRELVSSCDDGVE